MDMKKLHNIFIEEAADTKDRVIRGNVLVIPGNKHTAIRRNALEMKNAGTFTITHDEASSVIFGMPKKTIEMGRVDRVASLDEITRIILDHI